MGHEILLSVIVPAYNVEEWLPRCLDSICAQTYTNLDILVIDDGSTDETPYIADHYAGKDQRIRVIHQTNRGLVESRDIGIREAKGSFVGFVDGDDEIIPEMYERLVNNIVRYEVDISQCGILYCFYNGIRVPIHGTGKTTIYDRTGGCAALLQGIEMEPSLCNKIYRASLLRDSCLDLSVKNNEDMLRNIVLFDRAERSVMEDFCGYLYWRRKDSMSNNLKTIETGRNILRARKVILDYVSTELKGKALSNYLSGAIHTYNELIGNQSAEAEVLRKQCRSILKNNPILYAELSRKDQLKGFLILFVPGVYDVIQKIHVNQRHKRTKKQVSRITASGES